MNHSNEYEFLQEIFDRVGNHLLTQNAKSWDRTDISSCRYRGDFGRTCAVGCLITDDNYSEDLEGFAVNSLIVQKAVFDSLPTIVYGKHGPGVLVDFLIKLQAIHDLSEPSEWREELNDLAEPYNLKPIF